MKEIIQGILDDYTRIFKQLEAMTADQAYSYLEMNKMQYGLCYFYIQKYSYKLGWVEELFGISFEPRVGLYHWKTPFDYYNEKLHPKEGLIERIEFLKSRL